MASITTRIQLPSDHSKKKSLCLPTSDSQVRFLRATVNDAKSRSSFRRTSKAKIVDHNLYWPNICTLLWSRMPDCRFEGLIPVGPARYSADHVWGWNATESPRRPKTRPRFYSPDKASYRKISRRLKVSFEIFRLLWNLTGISAALLPRRLSNISKWCNNINYQSHGFGTSRDLTLKVLSGSYRIMKRGPL